MGERIGRPAWVAAKFAANVAGCLGFKAHATDAQGNEWEQEEASHLWFLSLLVPCGAEVSSGDV